MKTMKHFWVLFFVLILFACKKQAKENNYIFIKPYCATVTVGGVVGLQERCFKVNDVVKGKPVDGGKITIRIAEHSNINDGPPSSSSYQEFLDVPNDYLKLQ